MRLLLLEIWVLLEGEPYQKFSGISTFIPGVNIFFSCGIGGVANSFQESAIWGRVYGGAERKIWISKHILVGKVGYNSNSLPLSVVYTV